MNRQTEFSAVVKITPEVQSKLAESNALLARVKGYVVDSDDSAQIVNTDLQSIKVAARNFSFSVTVMTFFALDKTASVCFLRIGNELCSPS